MKKNSLLIVMIIAIICTIGIGYAYLEAKLNVDAGVTINKHCNDKGTLYGKIMCEANSASGKVLELENVDQETDIIADSPTEKKSIKYYSGDVDNNNVIFAGYCWKAYRTTETEGVKLIYNGELQDGNVCSNETSNVLSIESAFNELANTLATVGYKFNTTFDFANKVFTAEEMVEESAISFASSVTFTEETGLYTFGEEQTTYYDWTNYTNQLDNYHYTCLDNTTSCDTIKYVYNVDPTTNTIYYIALENGQKIEDAINEMINDSALNTTDSVAKAALENWYMTNLAPFDAFIEDTVYCNDRSVNSLAGWNPTGSMTSFLTFNATTNKNLTCPNELDRFTISVQNGNGKNGKKVGLLTVGEAHITGKTVLNSKEAYWLMTPATIDNEGVKNFIVDENGALATDHVSENHGIRPVISLVADTKVSTGDGTLTTPYVINTEE